MGKKLRKENDVSAFGESQTPFTFPTVSSNQKENEKKVPSDKINLRHFPIWFLITFHSMHFYCQLLLCSVGFFFIFVFFFWRPSSLPIFLAALFAYHFVFMLTLLFVRMQNQSMFSCCLSSFAFVNSNSHIWKASATPT